MNYDKRIHRGQLYSSLGIKGDAIPADFEGRFQVPCYTYWINSPHSKYIGTFDVIVDKTHPPKNGRKSSQHRIHIKCAGCNRLIPTGRWHQHVCKGSPKPPTRFRIVDWAGNVKHNDKRFNTIDDGSSFLIEYLREQHPNVSDKEFESILGEFEIVEA